MKSKKDKGLLILLSLVLALTVSGFTVINATAFASEGSAEILTIKGNGISKEIKLTRSELEKMTEDIVQCEYSSTNNFPTEKTFYRKGVTLDSLLKLAGIKADAKQIKLISSDGYAKSFTKDELLGETRYSFKEDGSKTVVPNIVALSDSSKGYNSLEPIELSLTLGQRVKGEQNNPWFVKYLNAIEVSTANPGQWEPVGFTRVPGADGVSVTLTHPRMDSVKIYYTLDGTNPTINSKLYNISATYYQPHLNKPILVTKDTEIRAIAIGPGKYESPITSTAVAFSGASFSDIADYPWARLAIESLTEQKIINGMGGGRFAPGQSLTRAQFATMMVLAMGETPIDVKSGGQPSSSGFYDVNTSDWHYGYVKKAAEKGWIKGYIDGSFKPERALSREEMLTIIIQSANSIKIPDSKEADKILSDFDGKTKISNWARAYVAGAERMGILEHGHIVLKSGNKYTIDAKKQASRAEAAVTVYKFLNVNY